MLDAIGRFVTEIGEYLAGLQEADRPGMVICLIMTDGHENASHKWSWDAVKALITQQREKYNWKFLFLGANIDAIEVGGRIGVPQAQAMTYSSEDAVAVGSSYASASAAVARSRRGAPMAFTDEDRRKASGRAKKDKT